MANRLDDIFGKKLGNRKFSPKESDWTAMENLIDAEFGVNPSSSSFSINWMFGALFIVLTTISTIAAINEKSISKKLTIKNSKDLHMKESSATINNSTVTEGLSKSTSVSSFSSSDLPTNNSPEFAQSTVQTDANKNDLETTQNESPSSNISVNNEKGQNKLSLTKTYSTIKTAAKASINSTSFTLEKNANSGFINEENEDIDKDRPNKTNIKEESQAKNNNAVTGSGIASSTITTDKNNTNLSETKIATGRPFTSTSVQTDADTKSSDQYTKNKADEPPFSTDKNVQLSLPINKNLFLSSTSIKSLDEIEKGELKPLRSYSESDPIKNSKRIKARRSFPLQLSLAAFGEVSMITKKITGDHEFSSLINIRNNEEKGLISFGGGIEFQAKYKGIGFNTGLHLSKYGENIQYEEKYTSEWEVNNILVSDTLWMEDFVFTYDSLLNPGDSVWIVFIVDSSFITTVDTVLISTVSDSSEVLTPIGLEKQNGKTTISYWEIPLYFSYQIDMGDFYLTPGVGVTFGFLKVTRGYYMAKDENSLIPIDTDYAVIRRTIINGQLNLGVGYHLNDNFSMELTPAFKFNLNNIFENSGIDQRYKSISLQFRLRYYF